MTVRTKPTRFGFCQTGQHGSCRGAVANGDGRPVLCDCPHHRDELKCFQCGHEHHDPASFDATNRWCVDRSECAERAEEHRAYVLTTSPVVALVHKCVEAGRAERAAAREAARERDERRNGTRAAVAGPRERAAPAASPGAGGAATGAVRKERKERKERAVKTPQQCECGCGRMTKGGRFWPGDDARLKSRLAGEGQRGALELAARGGGWSKGVKPDVLRLVQPTLNQYGAEQIIRAAVARRYGQDVEAYYA
jgi:hypothetical protein